MFEHLTYDPTSPTFLRYNRDVGTRWRKGQVAGSINKGYIIVSVNKIRHTGARIVWELCKGQAVPEGHKVVPLDGNQSNLNIENLMSMSISQMRTYQSLVKGQGWRNVKGNRDGKARSYFVRRVNDSEITECLGTYKSKGQAMEALRRRQITEVLFGG
ncbi:MAG: HNH endonuclease [Cetobacterium sp.]|uniref:HNH endonuclease n=1 Tax=Cetobacterium sp. TaxID=2071632 RepID=UPI003EE4B143